VDNYDSYSYLRRSASRPIQSAHAGERWPFHNHLGAGYRRVYAIRSTSRGAPRGMAFKEGSMDSVVAKITEQFKVVHDQLRAEVRDSSVDELNWKPAPETNSIAALVVHTLGSEAEVYRVVANVEGTRDRPAEFRATAGSEEELLRQLDAADKLVDGLAAKIAPDDLAAEKPRGDRPPQTGLHWLLTNYGHAREHLAHIQLTKQLYERLRAEED
jgi:hypothetical protein